METGSRHKDEEAEIDVVWDESGTARYRILKDKRVVDFDGHNLGWLDEEGIIIDYNGHQRGFYANGILRDPEGAVIGLGQDPAGPHPVLPSKGLIPSATEPAAEPKRKKPVKTAKQPQATLLWSQKVLEEL
jgi:hypothetical protein